MFFVSIILALVAVIISLLLIRTSRFRKLEEFKYYMYYSMSLLKRPLVSIVILLVLIISSFGFKTYNYGLHKNYMQSLDENYKAYKAMDKTKVSIDLDYNSNLSSFIDYSRYAKELLINTAIMLTAVETSMRTLNIIVYKDSGEYNKEYSTYLNTTMINANTILAGFGGNKEFKKYVDIIQKDIFIIEQCEDDTIFKSSNTYKIYKVAVLSKTIDMSEEIKNSIVQSRTMVTYEAVAYGISLVSLIIVVYQSIFTILYLIRR